MTDTVLTKEPDGTRRMRKRDRESTVEVVVFDITPLLEKAYKQFQNNTEHSEEYKDLIGFRTYAQPGYVPTSKGIYVIDTEGCGPGGYEKPCTDENSVPIPLYGHFDGDGIGIIPIAEMNISKQEIFDLPPKRIVNFAEWVREFGERLETNFHNWNKHLTPIFDKDHIENIHAKI